MVDYKTITIKKETWVKLREFQNEFDDLSFSQLIDKLINEYEEVRK